VFRIHAYNIAPLYASTHPFLTRLTESATDQFQDLKHLDVAAIASKIREAELHIALDNGGFCSNSRPSLWASGLAPITVNFPCQLGTLGSSVYNYFVSTSMISPPWSTSHFTERLVWLPHYHFTEHQYVYKQISVGPSHVPEASFILAHINKPYKMCPHSLSVIVGAMNRVAQSVLMLAQPRDAASQMKRNVARELMARGDNAAPRASSHIRVCHSVQAQLET